MSNLDTPSRRSIRLAEYDYRLPGAYFVTLCAQDRACIFGAVVNGLVRLGLAGQIAPRTWMRLPEFFERVEVDTFVVMPNHLHAVVWIVDIDGRRVIDISKKSALEDVGELNENDWHGTDSGSLSAVIQNFKSVTSHKIRASPKVPVDRVWQRNYWERIIRDERELQLIRQYISNNPAKWEFDQLRE